MRDLETREITVTIPAGLGARLLAFNYARNGSFPNSVSAILEAGLTAKLIGSPPPFCDRYSEHLAAIRDGAPHHERIRGMTDAPAPRIAVAAVAAKTVLEYVDRKDMWLSAKTRRDLKRLAQEADTLAPPSEGEG